MRSDYQEGGKDGWDDAAVDEHSGCLYSCTFCEDCGMLFVMNRMLVWAKRWSCGLYMPLSLMIERLCIWEGMASIEASVMMYFLLFGPWTLLSLDYALTLRSQKGHHPAGSNGSLDVVVISQPL